MRNNKNIKRRGKGKQQRKKRWIERIKKETGVKEAKRSRDRQDRDKRETKREKKKERKIK